MNPSSEQQARASRRTAIVLGLLALGVYVFFILQHVLRSAS